MSWKEFLKPTLTKIVITALFSFALYLFGFFEQTSVILAPFGNNIVEPIFSRNINLPLVVVSGILIYLLSSVLVFSFSKVKK